MDKKLSKIIRNYQLSEIDNDVEFGIKNANTVVNITFIGKDDIDLERLGRTFPEIQYNADQFAAAVIRKQPPDSCGLLFGVRKCIVSGLKTEEEIQYTALEYARFLQKYGIDVQRIVYEVMNKVICFDTKYKIDLVRLNKEMAFNTKYEPDIFPGCTIELDEEYGVKKATAFTSGKLNFMGVTNETDAKRTFAVLEKILREFRLPDDTPSTSKKSQKGKKKNSIKINEKNIETPFKNIVTADSKQENDTLIKHDVIQINKDKNEEEKKNNNNNSSSNSNSNSRQKDKIFINKAEHVNDDNKKRKKDFDDDLEKSVPISTNTTTTTTINPTPTETTTTTTTTTTTGNEKQKEESKLKEEIDFSKIDALMDGANIFSYEEPNSSSLNLPKKEDESGGGVVKKDVKKRKVFGKFLKK